MESEEDARDKRIESHYHHLKIADRRLKAFHRYLPSYVKDGLDYDFGPIEKDLERIRRKRETALASSHMIKSNKSAEANTLDA